MVRGASGDEWEELIGGKGTIGLQAAVPKKPHMRPLTFFLWFNQCCEWLFVEGNSVPGRSRDLCFRHRTQTDSDIPPPPSSR